MTTGVLLLALAGGLHLLIAAANIPAARMLDYRGQLSRVSPIMRDIFWVQNLYIELVLAAQAIVCWVFPADLLGNSALGTFWSGFLAVFWGLRLTIQLGWYDRAARREHPIVDTAMLLTQIFLTGVFVSAAFGCWKA